ncbi:MAG TPA: DUF2497 domain-containing protein [Rhizomicrobium sp.]|jgi:hypothetical protein
MANSQHEPTMEEILASIRKIISDDATSQPEPQQVPLPVRAVAGSEVLDLTHEIGDPPAFAADHSPAPDAPHAPEHAAVADAAPETVSHSNDPAPEPGAPLHSDDGLFSEKSRQALSDALAGLHPAAPETPAAQPHTETPAFSGPDSSTIESVFSRAVKEAFDPVLRKWLADNSETLTDHLKPLVRDWLDENFPALLEDAIRDELARAARPRTRR